MKREILVICPFCRKQIYESALQKHLVYPPVQEWDKKCSEELQRLVIIRDSYKA